MGFCDVFTSRVYPLDIIPTWVGIELCSGFLLISRLHGNDEKICCISYVFRKTIISF